jgi:hypothetical protein
MMALFREVNRLKSRIPKIRNSRKIISCVDVLKEFIKEFKQAMKSK